MRCQNSVKSIGVNATGLYYIYSISRPDSLLLLLHIRFQLPIIQKQVIYILFFLSQNCLPTLVLKSLSSSTVFFMCLNILFGLAIFRISWNLAVQSAHHEGSPVSMLYYIVFLKSPLKVITWTGVCNSDCAVWINIIFQGFVPFIIVFCVYFGFEVFSLQFVRHHWARRWVTRLCLTMCVYKSFGIHTHTCVMGCASMCTLTQTCIGLMVWTCPHMHINACSCACMYAYLCACTRACIYSQTSPKHAAKGRCQTAGLEQVHA